MLIVIDQPAYGTWAGREALDMAFSLAAFDQPVSLLFTGAGVSWLRKDQDPAGIDQKSVAKNLAAAPVFGIEAVMADRASCQRLALDAGDMAAGVTLVDADAQFLSQYDQTAFSA